MEMKPATIKDKYTRCGVSITILAELNACSKEVIKEVLARQGVEIPEKKINKRTPEEKPLELPEAVQKAIYEKLDALENTIKYHKTEIGKCEAEYLELVAALGIKTDKRG